MSDSPMAAEVLATTMRETLDGEVVTPAITVIDKRSSSRRHCSARSTV